MTTAASSPTAIPSHNMVGITMDIGGSPILSSSGAYLIHGGTENTRHSLSHTSRSSPATVCSPADVVAQGPGIVPRELKSLQKINSPVIITCICLYNMSYKCKEENRHWCTTWIFIPEYGMSLNWQTEAC